MMEEEDKQMWNALDLDKLIYGDHDLSKKLLGDWETDALDSIKKIFHVQLDKYAKQDAEISWGIMEALKEKETEVEESSSEERTPDGGRILDFKLAGESKQFLNCAAYIKEAFARFLPAISNSAHDLDVILSYRIYGDRVYIRAHDAIAKSYRVFRLSEDEANFCTRIHLAAKYSNPSALIEQMQIAVQAMTDSKFSIRPEFVTAATVLYPTEFSIFEYAPEDIKKEYVKFQNLINPKHIENKLDLLTPDPTDVLKKKDFETESWVTHSGRDIQVDSVRQNLKNLKRLHHRLTVAGTPYQFELRDHINDLEDTLVSYTQNGVASSTDWQEALDELEIQIAGLTNQALKFLRSP